MNGHTKGTLENTLMGDDKGKHRSGGLALHPAIEAW